MLIKHLIALLFQLCPVCLRGKVFNGLFGMHKTCPVCGIRFERETGYFLNAMFFAYTMGFLIVIPSAIYLYLLDVSIATFSIAIIAEVIVLWPLIFRYSRLIWLHLDQILDPREAPSASARQNQ